MGGRKMSIMWEGCKDCGYSELCIGKRGQIFTDPVKIAGPK